MITKLTIFFVLLLTVCIASSIMYRRHNRYVANFALAMLISPTHRKAYCFVTVILALILHYNHYRAFGSNWGYALAVVAFILLTRLSLVERFIERLSDNSTTLFWFFSLTLMTMFIPELFNLSIIGLVLLIAVAFYPSRKMRNKTEKESYDQFRQAKADGDYTEFVDDYFKESPMINRNGCDISIKSAWESMCDFLSRKMRICNTRFALFLRRSGMMRRKVWTMVWMMQTALLTYVSDIKLCI